MPLLWCVALIYAVKIFINAHSLLPESSTVSIADFSAWFEAYLEDRWWTFDARHNQPRMGRVLMATGRDASDVAMTTSFGIANLETSAISRCAGDPRQLRFRLQQENESQPGL